MTCLRSCGDRHRCDDHVAFLLEQRRDDAVPVGLHHRAVFAHLGAERVGDVDVEADDGPVGAGFGERRIGALDTDVQRKRRRCGQAERRRSEQSFHVDGPGWIARSGREPTGPAIAVKADRRRAIPAGGEAPVRAAEAPDRSAASAGRAAPHPSRAAPQPQPPRPPVRADRPSSPRRAPVRAAATPAHQAPACSAAPPRSAAASDVQASSAPRPHSPGASAISPSTAKQTVGASSIAAAAGEASVRNCISWSPRPC